MLSLIAFWEEGGGEGPWKEEGIEEETHTHDTRRRCRSVRNMHLLLLRRRRRVVVALFCVPRSPGVTAAPQQFPSSFPHKTAMENPPPHFSIAARILSNVFTSRSALLFPPLPSLSQIETPPDRFLVCKRRRRRRSDVSSSSLSLPLSLERPLFPFTPSQDLSLFCARK